MALVGVLSRVLKSPFSRAGLQARRVKKREYAEKLSEASHSLRHSQQLLKNRPIELICPVGLATAGFLRQRPLLSMR